MKLTPVNKKLFNSIANSMHSDIFDKTYDSASREVRWKIYNEIYKLDNFKTKMLYNIKVSLQNSELIDQEDDLC